MTSSLPSRSRRISIFALLLFMFVSLGSNYAHAQFEDEETKTESERKNDEYIADQARLETDRREWKSEYFPTGASIMKGGDAEILPEDISAPFKALGKDMPSKEILDKILVGEIGKASSEIVPAAVEAHFFLPQTARQYENVFGMRPTNAVTKDLNRAQTSLKEKFGSGPDSYATAANVTHLIAASASEIVMLVGHNQGQELTFLDGSHISFNKLLDAAFDSNKKLILVSCKAEGAIQKHPQTQIAAATRTELTLDQAIDIAKAVTAGLNEYKYTSFGEISRYLDSKEKGVILQARTKFVAKFVVRGLSTYVIVVLVIEAAECILESDCKSLDHGPLGRVAKGVIPSKPAHQ